MSLALLLVGPDDAGARKLLEKVCGEARGLAVPYIGGVTARAESGSGKETVYSVTVDFTENTGDPEELFQAIAYRIISRCIPAGFYPVDKDGSIIYILPQYGFDVVVYSREKDRHLQLNDIVNSVCAECGNFDGSWISAPDISGEEGHVFIVHIRFQDYLGAAARNRMRLACFFRLMGKLTRADFIAIDMDGSEKT